MTPADAQARLYRQLVDTGSLAVPWRPAYWRVARHRFLPERVWVIDGARLLTFDRATDPDGWLAAAYADQPVTTQLNDGRQDAVGSCHTSSASTPSMVFAMLEHLAVDDGHQVLEIGTGTGWNAGLLAARFGDDRVSTVEVNEGLAVRAGTALRRVGLAPRVIVGDGTLGVPDRAPYDRIIATAAVQRVPTAWVAQTKPGGLVLTPFGTAFASGALLRLEVAGDGTATGRFVADDYAFMWVRGQRVGFGTLEDHIMPGHEYDETTTDLHPGGYLRPDAVTQIGLAVPDIQELSVWHDDDPDDEGCDPGGGCELGDDHRYTTYLLHPRSGSWASIAVTYGGEADDVYRVRQHGPRHLADEVADAWRSWDKAGRPALDRYRVTVSERGQTVTLDGAVLAARP